MRTKIRRKIRKKIRRKVKKIVKRVRRRVRKNKKLKYNREEELAKIVKNTSGGGGSNFGSSGFGQSSPPVSAPIRPTVQPIIINNTAQPQKDDNKLQHLTELIQQIPTKIYNNYDKRKNDEYDETVKIEEVTPQHDIRPDYSRNLDQSINFSDNTDPSIITRRRPHIFKKTGPQN